MIHVNGVDWRISVQTPTLAHPEQEVQGLTIFSDCQIEIKSGMTQDRTEQVFFHELMHIILHGEEDSMMHDNEGLVTRVSALLYGVMKDNEMLRSGWFEGLVDERNESKREIGKYDPTAEYHESLRYGDNAEALPASGREELE